MKRENMVRAGVVAAVMVAFAVLPLVRPELLAPYAKLLPRWAWRPLQVVSFLFLFGMTGLAIARRRQERRLRAWTPPPTTPFRR